MNDGMRNRINLLMILVLLISCVQEKEGNNVLRRVEACMELFPDSALLLLRQIECPKCLRLGIIAFFLVRKRYRTKLLRNVEIIGNNNAIINRYACRIAELENASLQERQAKKEEIGILNRKILCLIAENKRVCENSSVDALFVLEELKQGNLIISNMTIAERQHIFDFLDLVHANFITRLKQEFDLTKNELLLAALLKVGFSNKQLMIVFDCEMKSIYKNRQRLKADLGLTKNDSLEQMVMMY